MEIKDLGLSFPEQVIGVFKDASSIGRELSKIFSPGEDNLHIYHNEGNNPSNSFFIITSGEDANWIDLDEKASIMSVESLTPIGAAKRLMMIALAAEYPRNIDGVGELGWSLTSLGAKMAVEGLFVIARPEWVP